VKCPGCAEIFTAALNGPAAPKKEESAKKKPDEDGEEGGTSEVVGEGKRKRRRDDDDEDEERVADKPISRRRAADDDDDDKPRKSRTGRDDDDDDDDDDDRPTRRRGPRADWPRVYRGLTMVMASSFVQIGLVLVLATGMAWGGRLGAPPGAGAGELAGATGGMAILGLLAIGGTFGALALKVTGHVFCLRSPDGYGSRRLAVTTLALVLTNLGCTVLDWVITLIAMGSAGLNLIANPMAVGARTIGAMTVVSWIGILAGLGAFFVFLLYLRSLARATGHEGLARNIVTYVLTVLAAPVALCPFSCFAFGVFMGKGTTVAGLAVGVVCLGTWGISIVAWCVWWIILLVQTRAAVGSRLRG
jgi:hypothetical protein